MTNGRTWSVTTRTNFAGSSKGGLCADCSNGMSRWQGASMVWKYRAAMARRLPRSMV